MAILRISNTLISGFTGVVATSLFHDNAGTSAAQMTSTYTAAIMGGQDTALPNRRFNIYTGTMPDFTTFTNVTQRAADLLIEYKTPIYNNNTTLGGFIVSALAAGPRVLAGIVNNSTAAAASGVATWFVVSRSDDLVNGPAIIGSVGAPGSGSDLEIPDVNIVQGQSYKSAGFYIHIPNTMTLA